MERFSFNNVRFQDSPHLSDEDSFSISEIPSWEERIEIKPVHIDSNNYLYNDVNADRFNSIPDSYERRGQPRGLSPQLGPVKEFEIDSVDDSPSDVFVDDFIRSSINEDKIVEEIKNNTGGI